MVENLEYPLFRTIKENILPAFPGELALAGITLLKSAVVYPILIPYSLKQLSKGKY